jgi:hypothetical protein
MSELSSTDQTYRVMRKYSHTDKRQLWSVESRPIHDLQKAMDWRDFMKTEHPKFDYFIVQTGVDADAK